MRIETVESKDVLEALQPTDVEIGSYEIEELFKFYKHFKQDAIYVISDLSSADSRSLFQSSTEFLSKYGIYFNDTSIDVESKQFILILEPEDMQSEETANAAIKRQMEAFGNTNFGIVVVNRAYESTSEDDPTLLNDNGILNSVAVNMQFGNRLFKRSKGNIEYVPDKAIKADYVDVSSLFNEIRIDKTDVGLNTKAVCEIIERIQSLAEPKTIFYFGNKLKDYNSITSLRCKWVYVGIAIYLSLEKNLLFDVSGDLKRMYMIKIQEMLGVDYNYASDYVKRMQHPLKIGVSLQNSDIFVNVLRSLYGTLSLISAEFIADGDESSFLEDTLNCCTVSIHDIDVLKIQDLYQVVSKNWGTALEGLRKLNKLCASFEQSVEAFLGHEVQPMNFTNLLLYRQGDKLMLGYINRRSISLKYLTRPLDSRFTGFEVVTNSVEDVFPFGLLLGGRKYGSQLAKRVNLTESDLKYESLPGLRGIALASVGYDSGSYTEDCGATIEEIGVWGTITEQIRNHHSVKIKNKITNKAAWKSGLYSYYGGAHPADRRHVNIDVDAWR